MAKNNQILKEGQGGAVKSGKGNDVLAQRPSNYKPDKPIKRPAWLDDGDKGDQPLAPATPAWAAAVDALVGGAMGGAVQNPAMLGAAMGGAVQNPVIAGAALGGAMQMENKPNDTLTQRNPKTFNQLARRPMVTRSDQLRNAAPAGGGGGYYPGFASQYGGNWGGGGGDWGGGGGYDNERAAWINYLQGLYSWNIK